MILLKKAAILTLLMGFSWQATPYVLPSAKPVNLAANVLGTLREALINQARTELKKKVIGGVNQLAGKKTDGGNAATSNIITRTGKQKEDVQNLAAKADADPSADRTAGLSYENDKCTPIKAADQLEKLDNQLVDNETARKAKQTENTTLPTQKERYQAIADRHVAATSGSQNSDQPHPPGVSAFYLMSSSDILSTIPNEQLRSVRDFVDIVAPSYALPESVKSLPSRRNDERISEMQKKVWREIPRKSLHKQIARRIKTTTGVSALGKKDAFAGAYFIGGDVYGTSVIEKIMTDTHIPNPSVMRTIAVMKAFDVHMSVEKFKASLDKEVLYAAKLARELKMTIPTN
jgi:hypothetical protein